MAIFDDPAMFCPFPWFGKGDLSKNSDGHDDNPSLPITGEP
jgi:hypothetical protein